MVHSPPPTRLTHPLIRLASKHQKEQANIDRLPDHSIIQIFSFLPTNQLCRCARVCRRWYNLAWDPRLWRTIRLTGETINVDRALKVLTRRLCQDTPNVCLMLETVTVSGCRRLTDRGLYTIAQCCPELRRLEVSGCYNISNEAVFDVVSLCPNLEHLDVSGNRKYFNTDSSCSKSLTHVKALAPQQHSPCGAVLAEVACANSTSTFYRFAQSIPTRVCIAISATL